MASAADKVMFDLCGMPKGGFCGPRTVASHHHLKKNVHSLETFVA